MKEHQKSKDQLLEELEKLRGQIEDLKRTRQSETDADLRRGDNFSEDLIRNLTDGFSVLDIDGVHIDVNPALCGMTGFAREDLIGAGPPHPYWPPEEYERIQQAFEKVRDRECSDFELTFMRKGGERFPVVVSPSEVVDDTGQVTHYFASVKDVTVLKQADLMAKLVMDSNQPIAVGYPDGRMGRLNPAFCELTGYTEEELRSMDWATELTPPEWGPVEAKALEKLARTGQPVRYEKEYIRKDGSRVPIELFAHLFRNGEGEPDYYYAFVTDIGERKLTEKALKESEEKFRKLYENSPFGIIVNQIIWDSDGNAIDFVHLQANPAVSEHLGMKHSDLIGTKATEVADEETAAKFIQLYGEVVKTGKPCNFEHYFPHHDRTLQVSVFHLIGDLFITTFTDTTERNRALEDLSQSEEKYRSLVESCNLGITLLDTDMRVLSINAQMREWYPDLDASHRPLCYEVFNSPPRSGPCDYCPVVKTLEDGQVHDIVSETPADDKTINFRLVSSPIRDASGKITAVIETVEDITENKRLQELESRAERLETAGTIAGQVAHDFNNLLAPLMAYPEFIREQLPETHSAIEFLDQMEDASRKIAEINQQLLTLGRRGHYNQDVINLNSIVKQACDDLPELPETTVLETDLAEDLMYVQGGGSQIHRVVTNLLYNAVDSLQEIGHIRIKTENYYADDVSGAYGRVPKGEYVKLTITDNGCGIPDSIIDSILDPFFTTKTTDKERGSGLGMSVVDAVVKDHNGYLDMETQVGRGTSFYIYFPVTRRTPAGDDLEEVAGGNESILVVDDDSVQREVSARILKSLGYEVICVESGEKAIEAVQRSVPDLVILDMIMPGGIDGAETFGQIAEINSKQKTIIVSGFSESSRVKSAQEMGAGPFVKKPLTRRTIAAAIRTELDRTEVESGA